MEVEYDGTSFFGWQRQPGGIVTVQGELERVLFRVLQEDVSIVGAGRTDRGVHARGQVASFATGSGMPLDRLRHAMNCLLPEEVYVRSLREVPMEFHARFSALWRQYRYTLAEEPFPLLRRFAGVHRGPHELAALNAVADVMVGEHDFAAFSRSGSDTKTTMCAVTHAVWRRSGEVLMFDIRADRFLRSMVRYLVSASITMQPGEVFDALQTGRLGCQLKPADPAGLVLWEVGYEV
ncbi:tRNA pseudouridine(38-40) synthase TruA [Prosthecochloris vibrioformis]|uniref:tRNA pseudouridine synthase A n=2 Tax=Chlorobiaceae TaxID=191412 RepID=A0A5C4S2W4_PROVB|nr:tRNA pseudouridine(38-40) synthase TruA [Prosthecochloris vibrioformis]